MKTLHRLWLSLDRTTDGERKILGRPRRLLSRETIPAASLKAIAAAVKALHRLWQPLLDVTNRFLSRAVPSLKAIEAVGTPATR
jgi:hypothetical protein